ncbi:family 20 glycosylhydrolase [Sanguibacter sp. HDW7]|uniref:family 20 glycosylhydrolase n=1 Tax=Sanguibacter sp. HDW7 TaxID=2714931 RepID=UPI0014093772|nr:family 20 glycosylhydrolase [Sanguibacter sp. HDW7]QIK82209.1 family 20 glycosylhydrolase [Sanguibacter sp. HDW7]
MNNTPAIIPAPHRNVLTGSFRAVGADEITALAEALGTWAPHAARRAAELAAILGDAPAAGSVTATLDPSLDAEGSRLVVTAESLTLAAADAAGAYWAVTVLAQTIDAAAGTVALGEIEDAPAYPHRGVMMDIARHFYGLDHLRRLVDIASELRFNSLHLHLTDDQGWRLEIPSRPLLTERGATTDCSDGPGGYLTLEDYVALQDHAAARHVEIVPEIDLPGHTHALLVAYPEASQDGAAREPYTGTKVGFSTVDLTSDASWDLVTDIVTTVAEHTRGSRIHLGGDECLTLDEKDYGVYVTRLGALGAAVGKHLTMWQEALHGDLPTGSWLQFWTHKVDTEMLAARVEELDLRVVSSPAPKAYLDMFHDAEQVVGQDWAGLIDLRTAYDWDPVAGLPGVRAERVVGVETALWTETVRNWGDVTYQLLPRIAAEASVAWGSPRDFDAFEKDVAVHVARWEAAGEVVHHPGDRRGV